MSRSEQNQDPWSNSGQHDRNPWNNMVEALNAISRARAQADQAAREARIAAAHARLAQAMAYTSTIILTPPPSPSRTG